MDGNGVEAIMECNKDEAFRAMECNKDEAFRAKEIAETKYTEGDYVGAKKFALKAQKLYPELHGMSQMLMTFDVYISSASRVQSGEIDWYGVLGVTPWADDNTIRNQYRKLALMLHPDKNNSLGAGGAFKLVSDAWTLLSDKAKRLAYNQKLGLQQREHIKVAPPRGNGTYHSSNVRSQNKCSQSGTTSSPMPSSQRPKTFWTICSRCQTHYEYMRIYLNHTLRCPNCHEAFLAIERDPPPNVVKSVNDSSRRKHHQKSKSYASGPQVQHNHFSGMTAPGASDASHSSTTQATGGVWQADLQMKRERKEGRAAAYGVDQASKKGRPDDGYPFSHGVDMSTNMTPGYTFMNKPNSRRELSLVELRYMLIHKARGQILKTLEERSRVKLKEGKRQKSTAERGTKNHHIYKDLGLANHVTDDKNFGSISSEGVAAPASTNVINVPDPDFHNFDLDRSESSFEDDQVWAAYDDNDGMPRYFARIHKVVSLKPFVLKISWLNSRNNSEFGSLDWVGSGFLKTCGDFRTGKPEITETLNSFSHIVKWTKGNRGVVRILPRRGNVWALYRHWSPDWNEHTLDEVIHKYDVVEVVDDYNEGISVVSLVKVPGFKTVFQKHSDPNAVRWIPKEEMFRFSHQVPDHLLTGEEGHNSPKGCRELDPAAIPLELLQVVAEASELPQYTIGPMGLNSSKANEGEFTDRKWRGDNMET